MLRQVGGSVPMILLQESLPVAVADIVPFIGSAVDTDQDERATKHRTCQCSWLCCCSRVRRNCENEHNTCTMRMNRRKRTTLIRGTIENVLTQVVTSFTMVHLHTIHTVEESGTLLQDQCNAITAGAACCLETPQQGSTVLV